MVAARNEAAAAEHGWSQCRIELHKLILRNARGVFHGRETDKGRQRNLVKALIRRALQRAEVLLRLSINRQRRNE